DPAMAEDVLRALVGEAADGRTTILFSSHQIAEVDQIADRVVIVDRGRAVLAGPLDELKEGFQRVRLVLDGDAPAFSFRSPGVRRVRRDGHVLSLLASGRVDAVLDEARTLHPVSVDVTPLTLKEIFLETTTED